MKTLILLMLVLIITFVSSAQNVNIPDANFKNALISAGVDTSGDGEISFEEAKVVTSLNVGGKISCGFGVCKGNGNISDLTGIEAFINLNSLFIQGNKIDSIDLSMNNDLYYLDCILNSLTSLDLSNNTALIWLYCSANQLTSLDVSNNPVLNLLWCGGNQLTSLDVSNNTALTELRCYDNQLTNLDVSGCTSLKYLRCYNNQLISLDVSNNLALASLNCSDNQLNSLDVSNNTALERLDCYRNQLTSLDVSGCIALERLTCGDNQLTSLDVSNNTELFELVLSYMPTLHEVCVWEIPFPPAGVGVDIEVSPNVCFETDCNGVCDYTEIEEYKKELLYIYPNPSDDIINIEIENPSNATIEIYNVSCRLVFSKEINSKVERIDVSGLSEGLYFVKVKQKSNVWIEKLIVY